MSQGTSNPVDLEFLRSHALFGGLNDEGLKLVASLLNLEEYLAGDDIVAEGTLGQRLYFIMRGGARVLKKSDRASDKGNEIAILVPGDAFGEMELLDMQPRSATVQAIQKTQTVSLAARDLYKISQKDSDSFSLIMMNIGREISRRLRKADEQIAYLQAQLKLYR